MKVVIAEDEPIIRMDIRNMLEELNHQVVAECRHGKAAVELAIKQKPDIILMDIKMMTGTDGLGATREIVKRMLAPVVLLTSYCDPETIEEAMACGALGYLTKPVDKEKLGPCLMIARHRFQELRRLNTEVRKLSTAVADREIISRSKALLQKKLGCSEEEAYQYLRKISMDQHKSMGSVAKEMLNQN